MPDALPGIIARMARDIEELRRRGRGRSREGRVVEADPAQGLYRVDVGREGKTLLTPWIRAESQSSGALKVQAEPTVGQLVKVTSENGDMSDAQITASAFDEADSRPHGANGEMKITVGSLSITYDGSAARFTVGGVTHTISASGVATTGGAVTHNGTDIGDTHTHTDTPGTGSGTTSAPN